MLRAMDEALRVREFWFGPALSSWRSGHAPTSGRSLQELTRRMDFWFGNGETAEQRARKDALIASRFSDLVERASDGSLASWADSPRRRLSLIILLDQFPRNLFRGKSRAFAYDEQALELALSGMQCAADGALNTIERIFFYMPLQHSEQPEIQDESVAAYRRLLGEAPEEAQAIFAATLESAEVHRQIIRRFGRFPSRNRALGRVSGPEERAYLATEGVQFGQ